MIILPTRRRLEHRRDALYKRLHLLQSVSITEVECIMRKIHSINLKLKTYFTREGHHEAAELFETEDPIETEDPTFVQIEEALGEIEI